MSAPPTLSRRDIFGLAAGGVLSGRIQATAESAGTAGAIAVAAGNDRTGPGMGPSLTVAGPRESELGGLARRLSGPFSAGLRSGAPLRLFYRGGVDGVTAANQFDAQAMPDGQTALLFSGSVMLAWLADTKRVHLDPAHVLPLFGAFGPGVLMVRGGLDGLSTGRRSVRLAIGPLPNAALTAMLGLDLAGIPATAIPVRGDPIDHVRHDAAGKDAANAVFLHGPDVSLHAAALLNAGFRPALSTARSGSTASGAPFVDIPGLEAPFFLASLAGQQAAQDPLVQAWHAMAAATSLCAVLVVPRLTPSAALSAWRQGVAASLQDGKVLRGAADQALYLAAGDAVSTALSPMQQNEGVQIALRRWMASRRYLQAG